MKGSPEGREKQELLEFLDLKGDEKQLFPAHNSSLSCHTQHSHGTSQLFPFPKGLNLDFLSAGGFLTVPVASKVCQFEIKAIFKVYVQV